MFYTGAPQNTKRSNIDIEMLETAKKLMIKENIDINNVIVHAPYIINLANNTDLSKYKFSIEFLKEEIARCKVLGISKIVLHPGSYVSLTKEEGLNNIVKALNEVLQNEDGIIICLETMAGKGTEIGCEFEDLKYIIDNVDKNHLLGICLDTCHLNDAGYKLNDFDEILDDFDKLIGIEKIKCIHINDSINDMGTKKDRHANIGYGTIGFENIIQIIYNSRLTKVPKILETPYVDDEKLNKKRIYAPYKEEIMMIKCKEFNNRLLEEIREKK